MPEKVHQGAASSLQHPPEPGPVRTICQHALLDVGRRFHKVTMIDRIGGNVQVSGNNSRPTSMQHSLNSVLEHLRIYQVGYSWTVCLMT